MPDTDPIINAPAVHIPVGLASKIGWGLGLLANVAGVLLLALEGLPDDASESSIIVTLILAGSAAIIRVNDGRQKQAAAIYADTRTPVDGSGQQDDLALIESFGKIDPNLEPDDATLPDMPDDATLMQVYPQASPFAAPGEDAPLPEGNIGGKPGSIT